MSGPARTRFIAHQNQQICLLDFRGITAPADALAAIAEARALITAQPPASVLTLTCVAGSLFNREVTKALRELAEANKPFVKAGAIVGMSGLQRAVYLAVTQFTRRRLATFATIDQAKDWLVAQ